MSKAQGFKCLGVLDATWRSTVSVVRGFSQANSKEGLSVKLFAVVIACSSWIIVPSVGQSAPSPSLIDNPVYKNNCVTCHGTTAKGHFFGPSLASDKVAAASTDELRNIITDGKGRMPKHAGKLTPEEIDTLVQQIQAMNKK